MKPYQYQKVLLDNISAFKGVFDNIYSETSTSTAAPGFIIIRLYSRRYHNDFARIDFQLSGQYCKIISDRCHLPFMG